MSIFGVDYAFKPHPTLAELADAGVHFVCRYLSHDTAKNITSSELKSLLAGKFEVCLNWESTGTDSGHANGVADAHSANAMAKALGRATAPIIFSMDFDPNGREAEILAYMKGVVSVIGHARAGLYSGYAGIHAYFNDNIGKYGWQTYAWSNGKWDPRAQLQQYSNGHRIGGASVDYDRAETADFGQINPPAPTPWTPVQQGSTGIEVSHVQTRLNVWHAKPVVGVDGVFGPATTVAVKAFQTAHKLDVDGIVGPDTIAALNANPPTPTTNYTVHRGDTMTSIAAAHHVSLAALEAANPQIKNFNLIDFGETIHIP